MVPTHVTNELQIWATRHSVSNPALTELIQLLAMPPSPARQLTQYSEAAVQAEIKLAAPRHGGVVWRNNVGVWSDNGTPVRYGLANESAKLNKSVKSSDLIGFIPRILAGKLVAVFTAIECKRGSWSWGGTQAEIGQQRFHNIIKAGGGYAGFARNKEEFEAIVTGR